uniref:MMS19 nucleotide excision repair protein homolog n=1 Tax=Rhizophora mucronata TaxID=61149 RepID=A0A2P2L6A6_RHIMU
MMPFFFLFFFLFPCRGYFIEMLAMTTFCHACLSFSGITSYGKSSG